MTHVRGNTQNIVRPWPVAFRARRVRPTAPTAALALLAMGVAAGCGGDTGAPTTPSGTIAQAARNYLNELVAVMQEHSVNRGTIDWNSFRASVLSSAGAAQSVEETFPAIRTALTLLGDGHSVYRPVQGASISVARACGGSSTRVPQLPATVGYVKVGAFSGIAAEARAFANALQQAISGADRDGLAGWVVDLRGNGGGNMWPMLAGVGPVLGEGPAGHFIDAAGAASLWEYRGGASWLAGAQLERVDTPYRLRRERPRVAVLQDGGTASSGEAIVIAFRQRPDTRFFGTATCGLSTANQSFPLSDGAVLGLTVAVMADRARVPYGAQVVPDENVSDPGEMEQRAVAWLQATGS